MAQGSVKRGATWTQRLLAFARRQTLDPQPVSANRLIASMEEVIRTTVGPEVKVKVVGAVALWLITVEPGMQVLAKPFDVHTLPTKVNELLCHR